MTFTTENETWLSSSSSRKPRKRHHHQQRIPLSSRIQSVQDKLDPTWLDNCIRILQSGFENQVLGPSELLGNGGQKKNYTMMCLGLGSPETSDNARAQLAFLLKTCDAFKIDHANISIYDPVFTNEDKDLLRHLGMRVLDCDSDPPETHLRKATAQGTIILFMPHCDLSLYESVLAANWSTKRLGNIVFICNHFDDYIQNNSNRSLESKAPHLLKLAPNVISIPLPTLQDWPGAFNSISVQYLSSEMLKALTTEIPEEDMEEEGMKLECEMR